MRKAPLRTQVSDRRSVGRPHDLHKTAETRAQWFHQISSGSPKPFVIHASRPPSPSRSPNTTSFPVDAPMLESVAKVPALFLLTSQASRIPSVHHTNVFCRRWHHHAPSKHHRAFFCARRRPSRASHGVCKMRYCACCGLLGYSPLVVYASYTCESMDVSRRDTALE